MLTNTQSVEEDPIQRAAKTTTQKLYDKGFFDIYDIADEVWNHFSIVERCKPDLEEVKDVIQWFSS